MSVTVYGCYYKSKLPQYMPNGESYTGRNNKLSYEFDEAFDKKDFVIRIKFEGETVVHMDGKSPATLIGTILRSSSKYHLKLIQKEITELLTYKYGEKVLDESLNKL